MIGIEIGRWLPGAVDRHCDVESLRIRQVISRPKVPFAHVCGRVSGFLEGLAWRHFVQGELMRVITLQQHTGLLATNPVCDIDPGWMLASHEAGACR